MNRPKAVQHLADPRALLASLKSETDNDKSDNFKPDGHKPENQYQNLKFTGTASQYFGIWIVNILLTVITLGIYSAWAKVRRRRYFQGHTILDVHGFGYHASGKQILLGRLIVLGMMVFLAIPVINLVVYFIFLCLLPLFYHRSLRFNARMTSYRNVRFNFTGTVGGAYLAFMIGPIVSTISFGVLMPIASKWQQEYIGNGMMYGDRPFEMNIAISHIYKLWLPLAIMTFLVSIILIFAGLIFPGFLFFGYLMLILFWIIYSLGLRNLAWSSTRFDNKHPMRSTLARKRYLWILLSNSVVSVVTLGLMRPWAAVRLARFTWENTAICFTEDIGEVTSAIEKSTTPIAAEYLDLEGFDFGF